MNAVSIFRRIVGLALLAAAPLCLGGTGVSVGVYQPEGLNATVLPELFKPWAASAGLRVTPLKSEDICSGHLKNVDVLAIADAGSHSAAMNLSAAAKKAIQSFVQAGGGYIGVCAGCTLALDNSAGLGLLPLKSANPAGLKRGSLPMRLQMTRQGQNVLNDDRKFLEATFDGGPVLEISKNPKSPHHFEPIGLFWEVNGAGAAKKNPLVFTPAVVIADCGNGRVVGFCIHPERTPGLEGWLPSAIRWAARKK